MFHGFFCLNLIEFLEPLNSSVRIILGATPYEINLPYYFCFVSVYSEKKVNEYVNFELETNACLSAAKAERADKKYRADDISNKIITKVHDHYLFNVLYGMA